MVITTEGSSQLTRRGGLAPQAGTMAPGHRAPHRGDEAQISRREGRQRPGRINLRHWSQSSADPERGKGQNLLVSPAAAPLGVVSTGFLPSGSAHGPSSQGKVIPGHVCSPRVRHNSLPGSHESQEIGPGKALRAWQCHLGQTGKLRRAALASQRGWCGTDSRLSLNPSPSLLPSFHLRFGQSPRKDSSDG